MNPAPQQALETVGRARDTELAVRIANKARAALAHERTALAALAAADAGASHRAIGAKLGISHVAVGALVAKARALPPLVEGRAGRSPLHIAMRHAAGEIDRDTLVEALATWPPFAPPDTLPVGLPDHGAALPAPGAFDEVHDALVHGYLDEDVYDAILRRRAEQQ
ncbi:hypothetical protein [Streptomyces rimosus]|uniref:Uncharacterized protein n=8 Tax=Streptomyces TaxID=1883 RepID=A0A8A1V3D4_STRR1|nr:hypothetical protein [Streptomyces rimosus]KOT39682.1 hypothetical protein ADK42_15485 [Streptomyces rimosus subsp. rimosus]QEV74244.1 hypothetical protein CP984_03585 [Streptomyces rimosus]QST85005.1 hypothetical protein SRIM_036980 [Streptomyces rimosus subsp. rimosus ATCC 10970]QTL85052.1 hypothetical protein FMM49_04145 [Streptomyces rimosus subsp. rimosus]UNZ01225.1 hypothetical protein SRIMR7_03645 [Streptomyces rimosus subsp. rimosus]